MEQVVDFTTVFKSLAQGVPLWGLALLIVKHWLDKNEKAEKVKAEQTARMIEDNKAQFATINEKLNQIVMKMASSGVDDLKVTIETLKEFKVEQRMKTDAAFRQIDELKAKIK